MLTWGVGRSEQPAETAHSRDGGGEEHNDGGDVFSPPAPTESFAYAPPQQEGEGGDGRGEAGEAAIPVFVYQRGFLDDDEYAALLTALKVRPLNMCLLM